MATVGTYDNTVTAGAASITVTDIQAVAGVAPTSYAVHDLDGNSLASGAVSGNSVTIPAPAGSWPPGWQLILFLISSWNSSFGFVGDALQVTSLRDGVANMPPVPTVGTSPSPDDPNNRGLDIYMHAFTGMGPNRWEIFDAANPTVFTAGTQQGGTIAAIQANIAVEQGVAGYLNPTYADAARPRGELITFPITRSSASGFAAGVAATVAALGPSSGYGQEWFEGLNEPIGSNGLTEPEAAVQYDAFRAAVKAGDPDAMALGPCEVCYAPNGNTGPADGFAFGPQISNLATFLANITPGSLDAFSVHDYNAYNGDFLVTDGWLGAARAALEAAGYSASLPMFFTETGSIIPDPWNCYDPQRLVQWTAQLYLTAERWGMPKEHIYWFFDTDIGGFGEGVKSGTDELRPNAIFFRVYSEEIFGKTYSAALDFGTIGNNFYRGNVYAGSAGKCVALTAQGLPSDTVTLAVSDAGPVTVVDWQGNTSTVAVAEGRIIVTIGALPTYVRLSAACVVSVVDVGNGLITGTPVNIAPTATALSQSGAANPHLVNNGIYETDGYLPAPDLAFVSKTLPDAVTLQWGSAQTIKKVLIRQCVPWANVHSAAMTAGKLEYWNGSGWLPCPTVAKNHWDGRGNYVNSTAVGFLGQAAGQRRMLTFYDQNWCHNVDLSASITTTKLRWTVTRSGYGHLPDERTATYAPFNFINLVGAEQQLMCSEIVVLSGTVPSTVYAPVLA